MANRLILKRSSVSGKVPLATDLQTGELAVNLADKKLYSKDASGNVITVGGGNLTSSEVTTALGYTPVNKAGDTMTGALALPSNGLDVGTNEMIVRSYGVGFGAAPSQYGTGWRVMEVSGGKAVLKLSATAGGQAAGYFSTGANSDKFAFYSETNHPIEFGTNNQLRWKTLEGGTTEFYYPVDIQQTLTADAFVGPGTGLTNVPLSALAQSGATSGQVAQWNGTAWVPATPSAGTMSLAVLSRAGSNVAVAIANGILSILSRGGTTVSVPVY